MASTRDQIDHFFASRGRMAGHRWLAPSGHEVARRQDAAMLSLQKRLDSGGILTIRLDVAQLAQHARQLGELLDVDA
jgi:hypothetical protein